MRRFIECLVPTTQCNLRCSYCYIIQEKRRTNKKAKFQYPPKLIGKALSKERLGGTSLISLTASGETFLPEEFPYIVLEILKQGHFVNITTNGTLSSRIEKFLDITRNYHKQIHMSFSLHYVELLRLNLLSVFFNNIKKVRACGCSILVQINLTDDYLPYWDEIKERCKKEVGAYPQVALTREENEDGDKIMTKKMTKEEYIRKGQEMKSPLFDFTCNNFLVKRKEYCYAGYWTAKLNIATGEMTGCYGQGVCQNIYANINKPIKWIPIGNNCCFEYCFNSSHFLSQGNIPEILPLPSYGELRNRIEANWYTEEMKQFLYTQFEETNPVFNNIQKKYYTLIYKFLGLRSWMKKKMKRYVSVGF